MFKKIILTTMLATVSLTACGTAEAPMVTPVPTPTAYGDYTSVDKFFLAFIEDEFGAPVGNPDGVIAAAYQTCEDLSMIYATRYMEAYTQGYSRSMDGDYEKAKRVIAGVAGSYCPDEYARIENIMNADY